MKKRSLCLLFTLLLVCALIPATAFAKLTPVAKIGNADFPTLEQAVQQANMYPGATIDIISDITITREFAITGSMTINLNGHTITREKTNNARIYVGGIEEPATMGYEVPADEDKIRVIINGPGLFQNAEDAYDGIVGTPFITPMYSYLTLNNVDMIEAVEAPDSSCVCPREGSVVYINNCNLTGNRVLKLYREEGPADESYVFVNGGSLTAYPGTTGCAVYKSNRDAWKGIVYINDCVLNGEAGRAAVYLEGPIDLTLTNCTVNAKGTGVYINNGSLTLINTDVTANGEYIDDTNDGSAIVVDNSPMIEEDTVNITVLGDSVLHSESGYSITEIEEGLINLVVSPTVEMDGALDAEADAA